MSKRFGRNQKRKMREQVAHLEVEASRVMELLDEYADLVESAKNIIATVRKINPNSIVLPPSELDREIVYLTSRGYGKSSQCINPTDTITDLQVQTVPLYHMELALSEDVTFHNAVHFNLSLDTKGPDGVIRCGYKISKEGLRYAPVEKIVGELVQMIKSKYDEGV